MKKPAKLTWLDVSRHRQVLYGFAALWIAFFHMQFKVPASGLLLPVSIFQRLGACGVEMFVLLTGPGLYRSMQRDPNALHFYRKRFARVFLPAVIVGLIYFGFLPGSLRSWLARSLYFPYWLGVDTLWYVAFILTMYLLYPLVYYIQKKRPSVLWALILITAAGAFVASNVYTRWTSICLRGVARFPVFLLSCALAPRLERDMSFPHGLALAGLAGFFGLWLLV